MEHSITVSYDRKLIKAAFNKYFIHKIGMSTLVLSLVLAPILYYIPPFFNSSWGYIFHITYAVAMILFVFVYFITIRQGMEIFNKIKDPTAVYIFSDHSLSWKSELGSAELPWTTFDGVLKFKDFWLLTYNQSYLTIPVSYLTTDIIEIIEKNCVKPKVEK